MKKLLAVSALAVLLSACSSSEHRDHGKGHEHHSPELQAAMKACHDSVGKVENHDEKFEACMKAKGFEKPANHPGEELKADAKKAADKVSEKTEQAVEKTKKVTKKAVKKVKKAVK